MIRIPYSDWGGGFKNTFYFHPDPSGNDPIWQAYVFQTGWFNHQFVIKKAMFEFDIPKLDYDWHSGWMHHSPPEAKLWMPWRPDPVDAVEMPLQENRGPQQIGDNIHPIKPTPKGLSEFIMVTSQHTNRSWSILFCHNNIVIWYTQLIFFFKPWWLATTLDLRTVRHWWRKCAVSVKSPVFYSWALTPGALGISSHHGNLRYPPQCNPPKK